MTRTSALFRPRAGKLVEDAAYMKGTSGLSGRGMSSCVFSQSPSWTYKYRDIVERRQSVTSSRHK